MIWSEIKREILNSSSSLAILTLLLGLLLQFLWTRSNLVEETNNSSVHRHDSIWTKNLKHITLVNSSVFTPEDQHYNTIKKVFIDPPLL